MSEFMQGGSGWDIVLALQEVRKHAQAAGDTCSVQAANAVEKRVQKVIVTMTTCGHGNIRRSCPTVCAC